MPARLHAASRRTAKVCRLFLHRHSRHTTAMHLLQASVDIATIALWLGHESIETTRQYLEADLPLKEHALRTLAPLGPAGRRFKADDPLLTFLGSLRSRKARVSCRLAPAGTRAAHSTYAGAFHRQVMVSSPLPTFLDGRLHSCRPTLVLRRPAGQRVSARPLFGDSQTPGLRGPPVTVAVSPRF
jgi:hypothetical protein